GLRLLPAGLSAEATTRGSCRPRRRGGGGVLSLPCRGAWRGRRARLARGAVVAAGSPATGAVHLSQRPVRPALGAERGSGRGRGGIVLLVGADARLARGSEAQSDAPCPANGVLSPPRRAVLPSGRAVPPGPRAGCNAPAPRVPPARCCSGSLRCRRCAPRSPPRDTPPQRHPRASPARTPARRAVATPRA